MIFCIIYLFFSPIRCTEIRKKVSFFKNKGSASQNRWVLPYLILLLKSCICASLLWMLMVTLKAEKFFEILFEYPVSPPHSSYPILNRLMQILWDHCFYQTLTSTSSNLCLKNTVFWWLPIFILFKFRHYKFL